MHIFSKIFIQARISKEPTILDIEISKSHACVPACKTP